MSAEPSWAAEAMKRQRRLAQTRTPPAVRRATKWLSDRQIEHWPVPLVPELAKLFAITEAQAREAIKGAHAIRSGVN